MHSHYYKIEKGFSVFSSEEYLNEDFIIWNSSYGVRDIVYIGELETTINTTKAWLEEPYEMVGPFCLEELCSVGKISFAACIVMTKQKWEKEKNFLYKESLQKQHQAQIDFNEEIRKYNQKRANYHNNIEQNSEIEHRQLLSLPTTGVLKVSEIKIAYRKIVKKAHPDVGGSHELFIKITDARDSLLETRV